MSRSRVEYDDKTFEDYILNALSELDFTKTSKECKYVYTCKTSNKAHLFQNKSHKFPST